VSQLECDARSLWAMSRRVAAGSRRRLIAVSDISATTARCDRRQRYFRNSGAL
jgi:hypothetical protein